MIKAGWCVKQSSSFVNTRKYQTVTHPDHTRLFISVREMWPFARELQQLLVLIKSCIMEVKRVIWDPGSDFNQCQEVSQMVRFTLASFRETMQSLL